MVRVNAMRPRETNRPPAGRVELKRGNLYDFPAYYDLVFGADCAAELAFLKQVFGRHCRRDVRRLFEPACGTGRLLYRLARGGFAVAGNDLNPRAVAYCNARLTRNGYRPAAVVGDMAAFHVHEPVDATFVLINSFRHLQSDEEAIGHLRSVAASLAPGGVHVLGLHLTPATSPACEAERWIGRRGRLKVISNLWTKSLNRTLRVEHIGMSFDVITPRRHLRIEDEVQYRTYTAEELCRLLRAVPELEWVVSYDFTYDVRSPITIGRDSEDVVLVLRRP